MTERTQCSISEHELARMRALATRPDRPYWQTFARDVLTLLDEVERLRRDLEISQRALFDPPSRAVNEPVFYRCTVCQEIMLAEHLIGSSAHERIDDDGNGEPTPVLCGPVRSTILTAGEFINRFLPANWLKDASLETWFPITAEELKRLKAERYESVGYQFRYPSPLGGHVWIDHPNGYNGSKYDASREIFAKRDADANDASDTPSFFTNAEGAIDFGPSVQAKDGQ